MMKPLIHRWLLLATLISLPAMAQEPEYQFGVRWSVNGLASSIDIQDVMLDFKGVPSNTDTRLPISQFIKHGQNPVKLYTWPLEYEADNELRVSLLYWKPGDNPNTEANTAFEVVMMPGQKDAEPEVVSIASNAPLRPRQNAIRFNRSDNNDVLEVVFNNRQPMPT